MSEEEAPAVVIGPAATGVGRAGKAPPLTLLLDMNGDGTPDYKEPDFWRGVLGVVFGFIGAMAPKHTIAGKLAAEFQTKVQPELSK